MHSSLSFDNFKKVFSYFCFITYRQRKTKFTHDEMVSVLRKISDSVVSFDPESYIFDLVNAICLMHKDGLDYVFTHRSFQEYFSAIFLKELSDQQMKKQGLDLMKRDVFSYSFDNVFTMLRDMAEQRFEKNILLPHIKKIEAKCVNEDKYDFYFKGLAPGLEYSDDTDGMELYMTHENIDSPFEFLFYVTYFYREKSPNYKSHVDQANRNLLKFLIEQRGYSPRTKLPSKKILDDIDVYNLVKETWIGVRLHIMATLKERLEQKHQAEELDLSFLLK